MRVVVTRPEPDASATARRLERLGHQPILLPLTEIVALPVEDRPDASGFAAVAVTSVNALRQAQRALLSALAAVPWFAVGSRTAAAAREAGFTTVCAADGDAASLAKLVQSRLRPGSRILYLCGRVRRPEFESHLAASGILTAIVETYDAQALPWSEGDVGARLADSPADVVLLYSAKAAENFLRLTEAVPAAQVLRSARLLCLSEQVAAATGPLRDRATVAAEPVEEALFRLLAS